MLEEKLLLNTLGHAIFQYDFKTDKGRHLKFGILDLQIAAVYGLGPLKTAKTVNDTQPLPTFEARFPKLS